MFKEINSWNLTKLCKIQRDDLITRAITFRKNNFMYVNYNVYFFLIFLFTSPHLMVI